MENLPSLKDQLVKEAPTEVVLDKVGNEFTDKFGNTKRPMDFTIRSTGQKCSHFVTQNTKHLWLNTLPPMSTLTAMRKSFQKDGKWIEFVELLPSDDITVQPQNVEGVQHSDRSAEIGFRGILQACLIAFGNEAWEKAEEYDRRVHEKFNS